MEQFAEKKIKDFLDDLASDSLTPGGGTASALSGALGASLFEMTGKISLKKVEENMLRTIIEKLPEKRRGAEILMDLDSEAFSEVMKCFRLPKNSDEEKRFRKEKIQEALKKATDVPLMTSTLSFSILEDAHKVKEKINPNTLSDFYVSVLFLFSGVMGGIYNAEINLDSIEDEEFKTHHREKISEIKEKARDLLKEILNI
ncbi:MAG: cyclodeaminase/cyclohydrolase family protein [Acidobacteriota bacterium]